MDRNTILAIVLSVVVIIVGTTLQTIFMEEEALEAAETQAVAEAYEAALPESTAGETIYTLGEDPDATPFIVETGAYAITFNPAGAGISSIKLLDHMDGDEPVELVFREDDDVDMFALYAGNDHSTPVTTVFNYRIDTSGSLDATRVIFTRDFRTSEGVEFTIEKQYAVPNNGEYLIQLAVRVRTADGSPVPVNLDGSMYTLSIGPQIGPIVKQQSNYDYRRVEVKYGDKNKKTTVKYKSNAFEAEEPVQWVSLNGKYFAFVIEPDNAGTITEVSSYQGAASDAVYQRNHIYISRAASGDSSVTDIYSFYAGPKVKSNLAAYNDGSNIFNLSGLDLDKVVDGSWLTWLENILKFILNIFYKIIPNYGVAIILLTILIKILLQPISKKSMEGTAKMSALNPKIEEIKEKYPDDPDMQNQAMQKLYQEEGVNPMGSCLPMLIQFPIFIALYGLLNNNFDLRGSMFIPGWIPDLSVPDTIFTLPFSIPLLGNQVHLLPILYTISMIYSMKITQSGQSSGSQETTMKFMTYGMPIMFFFVMYNAPSGLLLYWSTVNVISIGQQIFVNKKKVAGYKQEIQEKDEEKQAKKEAKKRNRKK